jgi:hypothetical protein
LFYLTQSPQWNGEARPDVKAERGHWSRQLGG